MVGLWAMKSSSDRPVWECESANSHDSRRMVTWGKVERIALSRKGQKGLGQVFRLTGGQNSIPHRALRHLPCERRDFAAGKNVK
ncbi:MAG: hypothetical protein IOC35_10840 [Methylobacterium sp.]|nr:hypothetical protein [Methylobacterium sp.]